MLLTSQEKPSEAMFVSTWGVSRPESAENIASFFSLIGKIDRYVGRIGPQTFNSHSTLSSSPRYDSRWDFEEEFRRFCAFLPWLVGEWLVPGGRLRDFEGDRQENMRLDRAHERQMDRVTHHHFLNMISVE